MEKLKVGVVGCGVMSMVHHLKAINSSEKAVLYAICDNDPEALAKASAEYPDAKAYADWKDLINCGVQAVLIVTPDRLHREISVCALEAGLHVLCEKPLALTEEDCLAIVEAADKATKRGQKYMVGQICRYTPGFVKAKEIIDSGKIGELTFVESEYAHDYKNIIKPGMWRYDPLRNGVVGGGCHAIDLLRWIAGDAEEVVSYSNGKTFAHAGYDDTHIAILKFPNRVVGKVFVSVSCKRSYTMRSVFYGTKGTIITDNTSPEMTLFYENDEGSMVTETVPLDVNNHNAAGEFEEFRRCIEEDLPISTTATEGAKTILTALAIVKSAENGGEKIKLSF